MTMESIRNYARVTNCRSKSCSPSNPAKAFLSAKVGQYGASNYQGFDQLMSVVANMKESNIWGGSVRGYFFKGTVKGTDRRNILSFVSRSGWKLTTGRRIVKYGKFIKGGPGGNYLLIFGYYRGDASQVYASLTIL
jgi:hypothetical protein